MKFRTAYSKSTHRPCPSGSRFRKLYIRSYDKDGNAQLVENGVEDVFDSIQKAANGTTLDALIRRAQAGDTAALGNPSIDSYADLSHAPKDLLEAHQMLVSAKDKYYSLPAELRAQYGNSFSKFLEASADGSALKSAFQPNLKAESVSTLSPDEITVIRSKLLGGDNNA